MMQVHAHAQPIESADTTVPLSTLRSGQWATVHRTDLHCDDCEVLQAMGLTDECPLRVCRRGEPCIVQVNRTRLGLSKAMAMRIHVRPLPGESPHR